MILTKITGLITVAIIAGLAGSVQSADKSQVIDAGTPVGRGALIYAAHCATCHDDSKHMLNDNGPAMFGVVNRRVGALADYNYSGALQKARDRHDRWSAKRLDAFLANPEVMYPGTSMPMNFSDADQRVSIIAYLKTLKD